MTTIRPFKSLPSVSISSPVDVYKIVAALGLTVGGLKLNPDSRRRLALSVIAYSLAGVRRGPECAEVWAARAQKQINDIAASISNR